jgi:hypothetical protein
MKPIQRHAPALLLHHDPTSESSFVLGLMSCPGTDKAALQQRATAAEKKKLPAKPPSSAQEM